MTDKKINHEEADALIAGIDLDTYADHMQIGETAAVKTLAAADNDSEHPAADFLGLKNDTEKDHTAFLRWRNKPEGVPVKVKVPAGATLYVARKGNYPFLYRDKAVK